MTNESDQRINSTINNQCVLTGDWWLLLWGSGPDFTKLNHGWPYKSTVKRPWSETAMVCGNIAWFLGVEIISEPPWHYDVPCGRPSAFPVKWLIDPCCGYETRLYFLKKMCVQYTVIHQPTNFSIICRSACAHQLLTINTVEATHCWPSLQQMMQESVASKKLLLVGNPPSMPAIKGAMFTWVFDKKSEAVCSCHVTGHHHHHHHQLED